MADIPQTVVEKAAEALDDGLHRMHGIVSSCDHHEEARTVLAAVWPDVAAARLMLLCSQCGEQPAAMVKVGTDDGWCVTCLDEAAEPPAAVVDRDALANALHPNWTRDETKGIVNAILASGVITDAADVRRQTAEAVDASLQALYDEHMRDAMSHRDIAAEKRKAGNHDGAERHSKTGLAFRATAEGIAKARHAAREVGG